MKELTRWYSHRIHQEIGVARWGHFGTPVLLFPTAGGDAEEIERFHLIGAVWPLIESGRIKVYSCDSLAGRAWLMGNHSAEHCAWLQGQFDAFIYHELTDMIRRDCKVENVEIVTAGASIGAFNAVATLCRHPDVFKLAIGMSGTYDLEKYLAGGEVNQDFYFSSPLHYLPNLDHGPQLEALRRRFILLSYGGGRWEEPDETWRMSEVLGSKGIPNRVDPWGPEHDHDWPTWREMLPKYLAEFV